MLLKHVMLQNVRVRPGLFILIMTQRPFIIKWRIEIDHEQLLRSENYNVFFGTLIEAWYVNSGISPMLVIFFPSDLVS